MLLGFFFVTVPIFDGQDGLRDYSLSTLKMEWST